MVVAEYHCGNKYQNVLVQERRKKLHIVICDHTVRVIKVDKTELKFISPTDYNLSKAKRLFRSRGRRFGITKAAQQLIKG